MEKCKNCIHENACTAWIRHGETLYDDFSYSVENCPHYDPVDAKAMVTCRDCLHCECCEMMLRVEEEDTGCLIAHDYSYARMCECFKDRSRFEEVVHCKECKHYDIFRLECHNGHMNGYNNIDGYCSYGERRTE